MKKKIIIVTPSAAPEAQHVTRIREAVKAQQWRLNVEVEHALREQGGSLLVTRLDAVLNILKAATDLAASWKPVDTNHLTAAKSGLSKGGDVAQRSRK